MDEKTHKTDRLCRCNTCESARRRDEAGLPCQACDGRGEVPSIMGEPRPCSRCRPGMFSDWYEAGVKREKPK